MRGLQIPRSPSMGGGCYSFGHLNWSHSKYQVGQEPLAGGAKVADSGTNCCGSRMVGSN